jgi:hypothetical protein
MAANEDKVHAQYILIRGLREQRQTHHVAHDQRGQQPRPLLNTPTISQHRIDHVWREHVQDVGATAYVVVCETLTKRRRAFECVDSPL